MLVMPRCDRYTARSAWRALLLTDRKLLFFVAPSLPCTLASYPAKPRQAPRTVGIHVLILCADSTLIVLVPPSLGVELAILPQLGKAFDLDVRVPIHRGPPTLADADESL